MLQDLVMMTDSDLRQKIVGDHSCRYTLVGRAALRELISEHVPICGTVRYTEGRVVIRRRYV